MASLFLDFCVKEYGKGIVTNKYFAHYECLYINIGSEQYNYHAQYIDDLNSEWVTMKLPSQKFAQYRENHVIRYMVWPGIYLQ